MKKTILLILKDIQIWIHIVALIVSVVLYKKHWHAETILGFGIGVALSLVLRLFSLHNQRQLQEYKNMGILRILEHRDSEDEYRDRIKSVNKKLWIMGNTAKRLIEDFADQNSPRSEKKVLCEKLLNKHITIKILIADKDYIDKNKKGDFKKTIKRMQEIKQKYDNFEVRYYQHAPCHSIFLFDDECLIGPMFGNLESKDTPTIHAKESSKIVKFYIEYFNKEWDDAIPIEEK